MGKALVAWPPKKISFFAASLKCIYLFCRKRVEEMLQKKGLRCKKNPVTITRRQKREETVYGQSELLKPLRV